MLVSCWESANDRKMEGQKNDALAGFFCHFIFLSPRTAAERPLLPGAVPDEA
jgi:hypothetical protein